MIKIGFSGTRFGMTAAQKSRLEEELRVLLKEDPNIEFHHGDCVGADDEAHETAKAMCMYIIIHPPENSSLRAFRAGDEMREPYPYIVRDRNIVYESQILIAAPKTENEKLRGSGTWATIRFAKKQNKKVIIINPDGTKNEDYTAI